MEELFKKIKNNRKRIEEIQAQEETIKALPYYSSFGTEEERQRDLAECNIALRELFSIRQLLLENLQLECNMELNKISTELRTCTLLKSA